VYRRIDCNKDDCIPEKVKLLNSIKEKAMEFGRRNRVLLKYQLDSELKDSEGRVRKGYYAEIAMCAIIGRIENFLKTYYDIELDIVIDYLSDMKGVDLIINGVNIQISSKRSSDNDPTFSQKINRKENVITCIYDYPGIYNLYLIMNKLGIVKPFPNQLISDINYIWELYMT
jgi:hypothetical protein